MDGELTLDGFLKEFGIDPATVQKSGSATEPAAEPANSEPTGEGGTTPPTGEPTPKTGEPNAEPAKAEPAAADPSKSDPEPVQVQREKDAQAFAAMRTQLKGQGDVLKGVAEVLGLQNVNVNDPQALLNAVKDAVIKARAGKQNIDPQLLSDIEQIKSDNEHYKTEELRRSAYLGFQRVKEQFTLTDEQLDEFATQLKSEGLNPFEQAIDLPSAFITRNFAKLVADAKTQGAQEEAERAKKANEHSSEPNTNTGQAAGDPEKITSVRQLDAWFHSKEAK